MMNKTLSHFRKASNSGLLQHSKRFYERMSTEEYLINIRRSMTNTTVQKGKLKPMLEANHGQDCTIALYSLPTIPVERNFDLLLEACAQYVPDIIFLQYEPMHYLTRQRFMSHKAALHEVEDYDKKGIDNFNCPFPMTWEESVVNLVIFDMLRANQIHMKLDYTKGLSTYAYPDLQDERTHDNLKDKFVQAITDYVICDSWSPYYELNQILFKGLMGKHKIILGDMPELLLRQILGNSLSLEDVKDIFKFVLEQISKAQVPLTMQTASLTYFSHIFLMPKDLYMTALLRNVMQAANTACVFVGTPHYVPIQNYWRPPPNGINFSQATKIPRRIENETDEMLIEKQAIIDVLLDSRLWGEKYITNPFPYIEQDLTKIKEEDLRHFKKHFYINLKKYQAFRDKVVSPEAYLQIEEVGKSYQRLGDVKMLPRI